MTRFALLLALWLVPQGSLLAATLTVAPEKVTEWKTVYGRVEAKDLQAARARIGGTVTVLDVAEGDTVAAGQLIGRVEDDKIRFQIQAVDAGLAALAASLANAEEELARISRLTESGAATAQRRDQLSTEVNVLKSQIAARTAEKAVIVEQAREGEVRAPAAGVVLSVPVTRNAVIMAGEPVATIGGGGLFLRLAIPERHAGLLVEDATLSIGGAEGAPALSGRLAKIYPEIDNGRVIADVEVALPNPAYVNARLLVRLPVGERQAILVPAAAIVTRHGLDFVRVQEGEATVERSVVTERRDAGTGRVEILTGLSAGDTVVLP